MMEANRPCAGHIIVFIAIVGSLIIIDYHRRGQTRKVAQIRVHELRHGGRMNTQRVRGEEQVTSTEVGVEVKV